MTANPLSQLNSKPALYKSSNAKFWDDPYISKQMLKAHLNAAVDSATRNHGFVKSSVDWISSILPPDQYKNLLDLGCGPGIYAELFYQKGYQVTGLDLSENSIQYAQESAVAKGFDIRYLCADYTQTVVSGEHNLVTLIYCDFGVLSPENREVLLGNVYKMLAPKGCFLFDVFTPLEYAGQQEYQSWRFEEGGFWRETPYLLLTSSEHYKEANTFLTRYVVVEDCKVTDYNVWEHTFTAEELKQDLLKAGFTNIKFFTDVCGKSYSSDSKTICVIAEKS